MGNIHINTGSWATDIQNMHVKKGSGWKPVNRVWTKTGAGWQLVWENEVTETFAYADHQIYYGAATDAAGYRGTVRRLDDYNDAGIYVGDAFGIFTAYDWSRGLVLHGNGSSSGQSIGATLNGRTIVSFKMSLGVNWTYRGNYNTDGWPTYIKIFGTTYSSIPTTLNPSTVTYLATVVLYPKSSDSVNYVHLNAATLGTDPKNRGDRYPMFRQDIDLTSQLSGTALTQLTNGTINSFIFQPYDEFGTERGDFTTNSGFYIYDMLKPGGYYFFDPDHINLGGTGNADAFRIKVTHRA